MEVWQTLHKTTRMVRMSNRCYRTFSTYVRSPVRSPDSCSATVYLHGISQVLHCCNEHGMKTTVTVLTGPTVRCQHVMCGLEAPLREPHLDGDHGALVGADAAQPPVLLHGDGERRRVDAHEALRWARTLVRASMRRYAGSKAATAIP